MADKLPQIPCQMPDLNTRKPSIEVPRGACDAHAHLFGPPDRYPYTPTKGYTPPPVTVEDYRRMLGVLGIEHAVIVHTGVHEGYQVTIDALKASQGRWRATALPDLTSEKAIAALDEVGFCGIRFNPYYNAEQELRPMEEIAARIKPFGWHLQFHLDAASLTELAPRLEKLPVGIVIDHLGHMPLAKGTKNPGFQILLGMLREKRCWVKLSAPMRFEDERPPYPNVVPFAQALIEAGPDRVVWGSDWPHVIFDGYMPNDGELLDILARWAPDPAMRKRILVDNPAALYAFQ